MNVYVAMDAMNAYVSMTVSISVSVSAEHMNKRMCMLPGGLGGRDPIPDMASALSCPFLYMY